MNQTIIGAPFEAHLRSDLVGHPGIDETDGMTSRGIFKIRAANSDGMRSSAHILVSKMYATRGYESEPAPLSELSSRVTLIASDQDVVIGTLSISFDTDHGLLVDELFSVEANALRAGGHTLCEFTKLAVDTSARSRRVLASLFHVAYIYAFRLRGFDRLLIEVNPRHVRYYQRMLGFEIIGPKRLNLRVNAPAVLLCLDFAHAQSQIGKLAGTRHTADDDRTLYPYFLSVAEEAGIVGRLQGSQSF